MEIIKIIGVGFTTALVAILLKTTKPELSFAVTITGVIIILLFIVDMLKGTVSIFQELTAITGIDNSLIRLLLKIVGVGYITEFSASVLQDFGNQSLADKVVLGGKLSILVLSLPIIQSLLTLVKGFLELA